MILQSKLSMKHPIIVSAPDLRKGQLWKLKRSYVYIVALMDSIIHFKLLDSPNPAGERTLTSGAETLWRYLRSRKGRLVSQN